MNNVYKRYASEEWVEEKIQEESNKINIHIAEKNNPHNVTAEQIGAATASHTQSASSITEGTFAGAVVAQVSSQAPDTSLLRNSKLVPEETDPVNNGEICWTYE